MGMVSVHCIKVASSNKGQNKRPMSRTTVPFVTDWQHVQCNLESGLEIETCANQNREVMSNKGTYLGQFKKRPPVLWTQYVQVHIGM